MEAKEILKKHHYYTKDSFFADSCEKDILNAIEEYKEQEVAKLNKHDVSNCVHPFKDVGIAEVGLKHYCNKCNSYI